MKIVVASNENDLNGEIDERFESSKYLVIVNIGENSSSTEIKATYEFPISEANLIKIIFDNNCEAIISGSLNEDFFNKLADNGITRFDGRGLTINKAIEQMNNRTIGYFRNPEGTDECSGHHHH